MTKWERKVERQKDGWRVWGVKEGWTHFKKQELKKVRMTAHLNPPSERRKTGLNEAASDPQTPEGVAPRGAAGAEWHGGGREKRVRLQI